MRSATRRCTAPVRGRTPLATAPRRSRGVRGSVWRNQAAAVQLMIDRGNIDLAVRNHAGLLAIELARQENIHRMLK